MCRKTFSRGGGVHGLLTRLQNAAGVQLQISQASETPKGWANPLITSQRFLPNQLYPSLPLEMGVAIPSFL